MLGLINWKATREGFPKIRSHQMKISMLDTLAIDIKRMCLRNDTLAHSSAVHMDRGHYLQEDSVTHLKIVKKKITCITFTFT